MDIGWTEWPFAVQLAYRDATGVNPQYALVQIAKAFDAAAAEATDEQTVPAPLLNLDPRWLLGFVWISERRKQPGLRFADLLDEVDYPSLLMGLVGAFDEMFKPDEAESEDPLGGETTPTAAPATPASRNSPTASRPARPSAGASATSSTSRRKSGAAS